MKERIQKVVQSVDRLTLRERLFLFAAMLAVLSGAWEALLAAPLDAREKIAGDKIAAIQQRLATLNESITTTAEGMSQDMPAELGRLEALRDRVARGDDEVKVLTSDLVSPAQMRAVLEELIQRQSGLRLISATNLEPQPLLEDEAVGSAEPAADADAPQPSAPSAAPKLFRHALVLKLEGSYLDCLSYLESVERLPWHLYWGRLEVATGTYPQNEIVIELRTLSLDEEWIGV
jgi:MSHA biogenesis protein MshJ